MTDVCFLCERNPITWPGTGLCEECHQETADMEHQAERAAERRTRRALVPPIRTIPDLLLRVVRGRVPSLRLERGRWRGQCPWCTDAFEGCTKPAFYVYSDYYHCYCCGAHGDAIEFLMRDEGLRFMQAVEWLAKEHGLSLEAPQ